MSKIYTRTGDQGTTSLLGGTRLPKSHIRFHAYGTLDELNAMLGLLMTKIPEHRKEKVEPIVLRIQKELFIAGGQLACDDASWLARLPTLSDENIRKLEKEIDNWDKKIPPLKNFILPSGTPGAVTAHLARTVCRRAERWTFEVLQESGAEFTADYETILKYLNRLSDHLFTLARWLNYDANVKDTPWIPS